MNSKQSQEHTDSDSLYLSQLEYTPEIGKSFLSFFVHNFRVVILIMISIMIWGVVAFNLLPLESSPEVKIPFGTVSVTLAGASPSDIEELVIDKLEDNIVNLSGVKQVTSTALNSVAIISVEFRAEEDLKDAIRRLRDEVENAKAELPADATDPRVSEVSFSDTPVWTFVITGPYDNFTLRKYAEDIEAELKKISGTNRVDISGGDETEISISFAPQKLQQYGLSMDQVINVIKANNLTLPLGTIELSKFEYGLRVDGKITTAQQLRQLAVSGSNGQVVRLQDIATVVEKAINRKVTNAFSFEGANPQNAVTINVVKKTGASIIALIDQGKAALEKLQQERFPADLKIETTLDFSKQIRDDFTRLEHDGLLTILLVVTILFLFVGLKEAFTAALSIPLVFAATFGLMQLAGVTINFLSLFSLILALGILVDDAIVVVQATKQYLKTGKFTPEQAVLLVFNDFKAVIVTTSLTTIFAFFPLVLSTGIIGEYIRSIPITVSLCLVASTLIAITINHPIAAPLERFRLTKGYFWLMILVLAVIVAATVIGAAAAISAVDTFGIIFNLLIALGALASLGYFLITYRSRWKKVLANNAELKIQEEADPAKIITKIRADHPADPSQLTPFQRYTNGLIKMEKLFPGYERLLNFFINSKLRSFVFLGVIFLVFLGSIAMPVTGLLKSEFLPPADSEILYVNIEGAPGLIQKETQKVVDQVESLLLQEKNIKSFAVVTGSSGVNTSGGFSSASQSNGNRAQFAINLYPEEERPEKIKSYNYAPILRQKLATIKGATIELVEQSGGPPSGADFEARFLGDDLEKLEALANQYKEILAAIPGTVNEKTSLTLSPGEFTFKLNQDKLQLYGLNAAQVGSTLRTAVSGTEITKLLNNGDELEVKAEFDPDSIQDINALHNLVLINNRGESVQLSEIADLEIGSSLTSIRRLNQKRVITLSAGVEAPYLPNEVLTQFQAELAQKPLPPGYEAQFGGQNETNNESIYSILRAMIVAFILIICTLVIQFNSFRKAVLVLVTIPLAVTGVFYGFTLIGFTLSFPSLIGILALFGIVVKNAIILIDKINLNLRVGLNFHDAIIDASKSRLEAIFLTTASTVIGMIPITLTDETWEGLGAALIFGLSASTILTLLVIPILFNLLFARSAARDARVKALQQELKDQQLQTKTI